MLQALLMLAIAIAFVPIFADKAEQERKTKENIAVAAQAISAFNAASSFIQEETDSIADGITVISNEEFADKLEPFGLPLGFIPRTAIGQNISFIIAKDKDEIFSVLRISGARLSELRRSEILSRIGFWGAIADENNSVRGVTLGWEVQRLPANLVLNTEDIYVRIPNTKEFSGLISLKAKKPGENTFHTDLDMSGNNILSIGSLVATSGTAKNVFATDFILSGIPTDRKNKNEIGAIRTNNIVFLSDYGNPLTITRSDLKTGTFAANSIANYGDAPALVAADISADSFNMTAGKTGFAGPVHWDIKDDAHFTNITLGVERLSIGSFLDTSRGQDVFLDATGTDVLYTYGSGVNADTIKTDSIVLRDQISSELLSGGSGKAILEIRPASTSVLPDVLLTDINNNSLSIPATAADNTGKIDSCKSIIDGLGGKYNQNSLANNIICQFVMLNRIEHRIEIKKCLLAGGTNCS